MPDTQPVTITNPEPIPVSLPSEPHVPSKQFSVPQTSQVNISPPKPVADSPVLEPGPPPSFQSPPLPATTTAQEDVTLAGQRRINILWESVQGIIAIMITAAIIYNGTRGITNGVLENAFFLIVSMYFVRTNHVLTGGVITAGTVPTAAR